MAVGIKNIVPESPQSVEVLSYSLSFILNFIFVVGLSLIISIFTGYTIEVIIALVSYALLRQASGGYHLESGMLCVAVSTLGITMFAFSDYNLVATRWVTAGALILCLIFAPQVKNHIRIPERYYPLLKVLALLMVTSNFLFDSPVMATAFFVQGLTLISVKEVRRG
ncbi:accessory gene regulator B family protein [Cohnella yongneupensis]|uniref:Accessory gene regulator B family protein n=1 Tax=Cohnella yongneupensis TaxID=425006 RepID=A0ABW0QUF5_9BACL